MMDDYDAETRRTVRSAFTWTVVSASVFLALWGCDTGWMPGFIPC